MELLIIWCDASSGDASMNQFKLFFNLFFATTSLRLIIPNSVNHSFIHPFDHHVAILFSSSIGRDALTYTDPFFLSFFLSSCLFDKGGSGSNGQLGLGNCDDVSVPSLVPTTINDGDGVVITHIACGGYHSGYVSSDGSVHMSGGNDCGQLGLNDTTINNNNNNKAITQFTPINHFKQLNIKITKISCGWNHTVALSSDNRLWSWGSNSHFQLGFNTSLPSSNNINPTTTTTTTLNNIDKYNNNNNINNVDKQQEEDVKPKPTKQRIVLVKRKITKQDSQPTPRLIEGEGYRMVDIACGMRHSMALTSDGKLLVWGCNKFGQLSVDQVEEEEEEEEEEEKKKTTKMIIVVEKPTISNTNQRRVVSMATGAKHSIAQFDDGHIYSTGSNKYGQLGIGNTIDQRNFKQSIVLLDDHDNNNNNNTNNSNIDIYCGWNNSCIIKNKNSIYISGRGDYGILGNGEFNQHYLHFKRFNLPIQQDETNNNSTTMIIGFAMGTEHLMILIKQQNLVENNSTLYTVGWNEHFQLGREENVYPGCPDGDNQSIPYSVKSLSNILNLNPNPNPQSIQLGASGQSMIYINNK
ncbi:regulator of chromosome condensation domain-containing protein [Cavenderia fasciculata]|uniref:Regulator of chromosome condensation domain-containing protein n=1 Tax=Cavenderia fasciculata TaxID=261658 RepID=F4PSS3_CACFS|nr:regulator of chromosome condensation domain-containing protein [Cavenderia fasciculata]EGG21551.1 regulator of chromosome condensation domain-containing protein [Cavenderia fasciculata]|eukprot:XP_004359401.1 regulator of chromosome condensation domain-containing protein [Cavenderia fasciculata]